MKRKPEKPENHERWLLTYSDLITLLMIFFVIMYAMSNVDAAKYKQMSESLKVAMGGGKTIIGNEDAISVSEDSDKVTEDIEAKGERAKLEQVKSQVDRYLEQNGMKDSVTTKIDERGLVVSLNDTVFFDIGTAEIKPESQKRIIEIGKILNQIDNYIRIEGHTDNIPIRNSQYSSNWQLSSVRAANATEFLIANCGIVPERFSSVGYGEYRPILDNSTEEGRARNRRVDIIIVSSKFNKIENNGSGSNPVLDNKK